METDLRPKQSESFPQDRKIQDGDTRNHQNISPKERMGNIHRLQGRLLEHSNTGTVQEVPQISHPGSDLPVQSTAVRSVNSSHGVSNSNSNWTFIALNLPNQEDSKVQQNKKLSTKFCVQGHNRGRTPRRTPGG